MATLRIEHPIHDYAVWKTAFDRDPVGRIQAGVLRCVIYRPVDDQHYTCLLIWSSRLWRRRRVCWTTCNAMSGRRPPQRLPSRGRQGFASSTRLKICRHSRTVARAHQAVPTPTTTASPVQIHRAGFRQVTGRATTQIRKVTPEPVSATPMTGQNVGRHGLKDGVGHGASISDC